jgi:hypothetical protein
MEDAWPRGDQIMNIVSRLQASVVVQSILSLVDPGETKKGDLTL